VSPSSFAGIGGDLVERVNGLAGPDVAGEASNGASEEGRKVTVGIDPFPTPLERGNDSVGQEIQFVPTRTSVSQAPMPICRGLLQTDKLSGRQCAERVFNF